VLLRGKRVELKSAQQAIDAGLALIPEDRRAQGLVLDHSVRDNLLLPLLPGLKRGPLLDERRSNVLTARLLRRFEVKVRDPRRPARLLSGGNQQKVVIAKWLATEPDVLLMDEPTAGVDIGTKAEIVAMIRKLADEGKAVVVVSSELAELLAVSDRVLVMREGRIVDELLRADIPDERSLQLSVQGVAAS
jgi:ribose transport system ATP-binding protein